MGNGSSTSRFGKSSTAKEVLDALGPDLRGKVAIVTGGNSGIGLETCKALASAGAKIVLCSRSVEAGEAAVKSEFPSPGEGGYVVNSYDVVVKRLDLSSLASVRDFVADVNSTVDHIDYLVLNAGVMAIPERQTTVDGFEMQIGVNHFGHFYLTQLLLPRMKTQNHPSRIVVLSSLMHKYGTIELNDLHFDKGRSYGATSAYSQSKLANLLFANTLAEECAGTSVTPVSVHPGVIQTNLIRHSLTSRGLIFSIYKNFIVDKSIPQGASTTLYGCLAPELVQRPGSYLSDCAVCPPGHSQKADSTLARKLWDETKKQLAAALAKL